MGFWDGASCEQCLTGFALADCKECATGNFQTEQKYHILSTTSGTLIISQSVCFPAFQSIEQLTITFAL